LLRWGTDGGSVGGARDDGLLEVALLLSFGLRFVMAFR
jgi:hypothetical protein